MEGKLKERKIALEEELKQTYAQMEHVNNTMVVPGQKTLKILGDKAVKLDAKYAEICNLLGLDLLTEWNNANKPQPANQQEPKKDGLAEEGKPVPEEAV